MRKVLLITTFLPNIGGGSVILRSLIPPLKDKAIDVQWLYSHERDIDFPGAQCIGEQLMGGNVGKDFVNSFLLWLGVKTPALKSRIDKILSLDADAYWVVGYNEGVLIALELARRTNVPVHLTMHDDLVHGVFSRSRRYRWLSGLAQQRFAEAMNAVRSVDVVSKGMHRYYQKTLGVDSVVIHRYLPNLPDLPSTPSAPKTLIVGHIGSIYSGTQFHLFCQALQDYAQKEGLLAKFVVIGADRRFLPIFQEFSQLMVDFPQLTETEAIEQLASCHFLYAMYPFEQALAIFRQTSLPTKMTTYLQVQRPILSHTPGDSTLAEIVSTYEIGLNTAALTVSEMTRAIEQICTYQVSTNAFENTRAALFGIENVNHLVDCLA